MRRQMQAMHAHLERMSAEMAEMQKRFESQIREFERRLAQDL
jgi:hypothetical protein